MISIGKFVGWRRNALAFMLGIFATLTFAPFYFFPLIIPAYGGLFLLVNNASSRKRAFADGWWWGWGFYISGLYWFCIAMLTDAEKFAWAIPFALFGLNAIVALYPAFACLIFFVARSRKKYGVTGEAYEVTEGVRGAAGASNVLFFSIVWLLVEYARGHLFSGFPWNLSGYAFNFSDISLQLASVVGIYGLTFFVVLLGSSVAVIKNNFIFVFIVWGLFLIGLGWGYNRLEEAQEGKDTGNVLRLVQANIQQHMKWDPELQEKNLEDLISLTQGEGIEKVTHVIWPETAIPYQLWGVLPPEADVIPTRYGSDEALIRHIGSSLPLGVTLVTGALQAEGWGKRAKFYNIVMAIDNSGKVVGSYYKHVLVPFGEFLPLRYLIPEFLKLPVGNFDFSTGSGVRTVNWAGLPPASVLICYEGVFTEFAVDKNNRPDWLLDVANDAWFGMSTGPYQHFEMVRMRAVEQGLPMVRVANTGITAYIDEYGRIKQQIKLGEKGIIDIPLKQSLLRGTIYARYGDYFLLLSISFLMILAAIRKRLINS